ncbi:MAG TPA: HAMP domain-containing histidine kinase, partial [Firmicutes bacterium]|nr:HAMP domain-containing histidine kinase [Bacillota bacterium]
MAPFLKAYWKQCRKGLGIFLLFSLIFLGVFLLYGISIEAVVYPAILCGLLGLIFLALDMHRAWRTYRQLEILKTLPAPLMEPFPEPDTMEAAEYQEIIRTLREGQKQLESGMALRYEEMVEYYTIWAHQIKTPIASMRLTLQNEDSELSRRLSEDLLRIEQYVEMVLCYLRLDSSSTDYVFQEYDLDSIVKQAVRKFAGQFIRRKIRLDYQPLHTRVVTDEKWLLFVVEQVLSNALKYTPAAGTVTIDLEEPKTLC